MLMPKEDSGRKTGGLPDTSGGLLASRTFSRFPPKEGCYRKYRIPIAWALGIQAAGFLLGKA